MCVCMWQRERHAPEAQGIDTHDARHSSAHAQALHVALLDPQVIGPLQLPGIALLLTLLPSKGNHSADQRECLGPIG